MNVLTTHIAPQFLINGPFRFIKSYSHCFKTHAKGRWFNKKLIDVLEKEFKAYTKQYYVLISNKSMYIITLHMKK